jgi:hypothetical protein
MLATRTTVLLARSRHVGSGATGAREPSQVRKEAALSGSAWVPPGRLTCAASGPLSQPRGRAAHEPQMLATTFRPALGFAPPTRRYHPPTSGGVRERPNRHAWKACVGQLTVGSNPTPSANSRSGRRNRAPDERRPGGRDTPRGSNSSDRTSTINVGAKRVSTDRLAFVAARQLR